MAHIQNKFGRYSVIDDNGSIVANYLDEHTAKGHLDRLSSKTDNTPKEIPLDKKNAMLDLIHAIRIGRKDFSNIAEKLDRLGVPMWKQNMLAYLATETPNEYGTEIVRKVYFMRRKWK